MYNLYAYTCFNVLIKHHNPEKVNDSKRVTDKMVILYVIPNVLYVLMN